MLEAEVWTVARTEQGNAVLVRPVGGEVAVPIFIGPLEAQSILFGMGNVPMPRPLTHDLMLAMFNRIGVRVDRVEITALKDDTFFARLVLIRDGEEIDFDARPSDSLALAVRVHCPVFIAENVVEEAAISIHLITEEEGASEESADQPTKKGEFQSPREGQISRLKKELEKAVEEENYEEAARLRDRLNELESSS